MASQFPIIGAWYQELSGSLVFEVVAVDENAATIEIQYASGDIDEFDFDVWQQLTLRPAAPPQDSETTYGLNSDEYWDDEMGITDEYSSNFIEDLGFTPDSYSGLEDF